MRLIVTNFQGLHRVLANEGFSIIKTRSAEGIAIHVTLWLLLRNTRINAFVGRCDVAHRRFLASFHASLERHIAFVVF